MPCPDRFAPGVLALALGLVGCSDDVVVGAHGLDAGAVAIASGPYDLSLGDALDAACVGVLVDQRGALEAAGAAAFGLAAGPVDLTMPAGYVVIGGAAIAASFGLASLALAPDRPGLPAAWFAASVPVDGSAPLDTTRLRATLALEDLATGAARASVEVVRPGGADRCTITYAIALAPR